MSLFFWSVIFLQIKSQLRSSNEIDVFLPSPITHPLTHTFLTKTPKNRQSCIANNVIRIIADETLAVFPVKSCKRDPLEVMLKTLFVNPQRSRMMSMKPKPIRFCVCSTKPRKDIVPPWGQPAHIHGWGAQAEDKLLYGRRSYRCLFSSVITCTLRLRFLTK